jgi:hypothetical protein
MAIAGPGSNPEGESLGGGDQGAAKHKVNAPGSSKGSGKTAQAIQRQSWYSVDWPVCPCSECGAKNHWRKMTQEWSLANAPHERLGDDEELWNVVRLCAECLAKKRGITVIAAMAAIVEEAPVHNKRKEANERFNEADRRAAEAFEGLSKGERRRISVAMMRGLLAPISKFLKLKVAVFRKRSQVLEEQEEMIVKLKACNSIEEAMALMPAMEELEAKLDQLDVPLAFADKGAKQYDWIAAADYSDEWSCEYHPDGTIKTAMRVFHVCLGGGTEHACNTVIEGETWVRWHEDPLATGQRWYCPLCSTKYKTKFGVLVELHIAGSVYFLLAEYPKAWNDVKHMKVEFDFAKQVSTPKELYDKIMAVQPYTGDGFLRPAMPHEVLAGRSTDGIYRFADKAAFTGMAKWSWDDLASFTKVLG